MTTPVPDPFAPGLPVPAHPDMPAPGLLPHPVPPSPVIPPLPAPHVFTSPAVPSVPVQQPEPLAGERRPQPAASVPAHEVPVVPAIIDEHTITPSTVLTPASDVGLHAPGGMPPVHAAVPPAHALSPAEVQAVLDKAVEDKRKELGLDPATVKARQEEAAARAVRQKDVALAHKQEEEKRAREARLQEPDRWVGLDAAASGTYSYVKVAVAARQHKLTVDGVTYEHVATDGEGIWLYRYMP